MRDLRGGQHDPVPSSSLPRRALVAGWVVAVLVAAGLALAAVSVAQLLEVRSERDDAERATAAARQAATDTEAELVAQQAFLAEAGVDLDAARAALTATDDALDLVSLDRALVAAELEAVRAQLQQLQEAVTGAVGQAFANAGMVNGLAECLDGVSELVNQLSVGDRNGAVRTADAIAPSCAAVGAAIA